MTKFQRLSRQERMTQIQRAAQQLFLDKGFKRTTMEDIVELSGMSKGGVYNYYKSTSDILYDIMMVGMQYRMDSVWQALSTHPNQPKEEIVLESLIDKMTDYNDFKAIYVIFLIESRNNPKLQSLYRKLEEESIKILIENFQNMGFVNAEPFFSKSIIAFINSIMIGSIVLQPEVFAENREMFRVMLKAYLENKKEDKVK